MSLIKNHFGRMNVLVATLLLTVSFAPRFSMAQESLQEDALQENAAADKQDDASQELTDFSFDLDSLPPQPTLTPSVLPEEEASVPSPIEIGTVAVPDVAVNSDQPLTPMMPETAALESVVAESLPTGQAAPIPHSGLYYDSASIVPSSALGTSIGPREVDPKYEPGSKYVVVQRGASANSREARIVAAQRALKLGRYTSALEIYEKLYKKAPKNARILMGLAVAQQHSGFTESAIATYEELLVINPKNTDATVNMLGLIRTQYPSVAFRKLRDLWDKNSQNPALAAQLGLTSASIGNAEDALRYLGIAASIDPRNASHFYNMAVVSDQAGAHKDAVDLYQKALEIDISYGGGRSIPREQVYDRLAQLRRL